jgi:chromosome segregation ATPase
MSQAIRTTARSATLIDTLESRTLLNGSFGGFHFFQPPPLSDAVKADLATIKTDQAKLAADRTALAPTIEADRQAIEDAIKALNTTLQPLRDELQKDATTWRTTLQADFKTLLADRGDRTKVTADLAKLKADQTAARTEITGDYKAIQDAITNDPTVKAARDKLTTDAKPITDDLAKLQADYQQLAKDFRAQFGGTGGTGGTTTV